MDERQSWCLPGFHKYLSPCPQASTASVYTVCTPSLYRSLHRLMHSQGEHFAPAPLNMSSCWCGAGEKGSDASAKETTRKLLAAARQQHALANVVAACTGRLHSHALVSVQMLNEGCEPNGQPDATWSYRNTRVREVLHELSQTAVSSRQ